MIIEQEATTAREIAAYATKTNLLILKPETGRTNLCPLHKRTIKRMDPVILNANPMRILRA